MVAARLGEGAPVLPPVFGRAQLAAHGLSTTDARRLLANGTWTALRRGAYVRTEHWEQAGAAQRHELECAALLLVSPRELVVSHGSAAVLHGIPLLQEPAQPVVTRPRPVDGPALHPPRASSARLLPTETVLLRGLRVTSLLRTAADLARTLDEHGAAVAVDGALHLGLQRAALAAALGQVPGWPGVARARALVADAEPLAESALETLTRRCVLAHGFPVPVAQLVVRDARGAFLGRVDMGWQRERVALEADGKGKYATRVDLWAEKRREDALRDAGWQVVRAYWSDLADGGAALAGRLHRAFARSAAAL